MDLHNKQEEFRGSKHLNVYDINGLYIYKAHKYHIIGATTDILTRKEHGGIA